MTTTRKTPTTRSANKPRISRTTPARTRASVSPRETKPHREANSAPLVVRLIALGACAAVSDALLARADATAQRLLREIASDAGEYNGTVGAFVETEAKRLRPDTYAELEQRDMLGDAQVAYQDPAFALGLTLAYRVLRAGGGL